MLIQKLQSDLYNFIDKDPDDRRGLIEYWYCQNSTPLSAALYNNTDIQIMINLTSFELFEKLSKKLFLIADTIVLRDSRTYSLGDDPDYIVPNDPGVALLPIVENYRPGVDDDVIRKINGMRLSPLTMQHAIASDKRMISSDTKQLNNGYKARYAMSLSSFIPDEFIDWILSDSGRMHLKTGRIMYAPFIPPLEVELGFLKENVSLPQHFNVLPCFHQRYDWLNDDNLKALFSLNFPFLDNLDIETISKVKDNHHDEFKNFSKSLTEAISTINSSFGSEGFIKEVKYIQEHLIDSSLSDIDKTMKKIKSSSSLRKLGIITGLVGLNAAVHLGASAPAVASGVIAASGAFIMDKIKEMKDRGELKEKAPYFLWELGKAQKS